MSSAGKADASPLAILGDIERVFGPAVAALTRIIASRAQDRSQSLYFVGGMARDVLLGRGKPDLDFALEADAIAFARAMSRRYGGRIASYQGFGTATWILDERAADQLRLPFREIPHRIDFVRTRSESYAYPTALPTVKPGQIEDDLRRRDFTINALALQLSPKPRGAGLIDISGGLQDLRAERIRALHERSFVDDPTRIFRAIRFAVRLGFTIEEGTGLWLRSALPLIGRLSGARLRNELDLILREERAGDMLLRLRGIGALEAIHPAFRVSERLPEILARAESADPTWKIDTNDAGALKWSLMLHSVGAGDAPALCERLHLSKAAAASVVACVGLIAADGALKAPEARPSQLSRLLANASESAIQAAWLLSLEKPLARERLANYMLRWRYQGASISGKELKALGLPPGPIYRRILGRLRDAWIDGEIHNQSDELALLECLLQSEGE